MLFNSIEFAAFFPVVVALYYLLPPRWRVGFLLAASCFFYMAFIPAYIAILFVTILIDYVAGIYIEKVAGRPRKTLLLVSIVSTCSVLAVFKYMNFLTGSFEGLAGLVGWHLPNAAVKIILPIGLSFHTFQSLSYVVEVYRGKQKAERNFIVYATYVMFFPQLVAGPIERPQQLLHQFREWHRVNYININSGLKRMAWGFFKKLVVADRLALYVNDVYAAPRSYNGLQFDPRNLLLRLSNILRFFRLFRYCHRSRTSAGVQAHGELQNAVSLVIGLRILAALAYIALYVV